METTVSFIFLLYLFLPKCKPSAMPVYPTLLTMLEFRLSMTKSRFLRPPPIKYHPKLSSRPNLVNAEAEIEQPYKLKLLLFVLCNSHNTKERIDWKERAALKASIHSRTSIAPLSRRNLSGTR